jgi:hypothetical protein
MAVETALDTESDHLEELVLSAGEWALLNRFSKAFGRHQRMVLSLVITK